MNPTRVFYVVFRKVKDRHVLLKHDEAFATNAVGASIWELCDGSRTEKEIAESIARKYDISYEIVEKDVAEFLAELRDLGLIE